MTLHERSASGALTLALLTTLSACGGGSDTDAGVDATADAVADSAPDTAPPLEDSGPDGSSVCSVGADCDDGIFCNGNEVCDPTAAAADAMGCVAGAGDPCLAGQTCSETDGRCQTMCDIDPDADGDGEDAFECGGDDCDDADGDRFPGNLEDCDTHDEDCDPSTFGDRDLDRDGFVDALCCNDDGAGGTNCGDDCADGLATVHRTAPEVCNGLDDDCDGTVDNGVLVMGFVDSDGDLHGDPTMTMLACPDTAGFSTVDDDCDDDDPNVHGAQLEFCDGKDNDCDTDVDEDAIELPWYPDGDSDGFGRGGAVTVSCSPPADHALLPLDCADDDASVFPAGPEVCNGLDDDCNGIADFVIAPGDREDDDGDGHPDLRCPDVGTDCDDRDPFAGPGAPELCDMVDNDCDGAVDEMAMDVAWYIDADGDGYGDSGVDTIVSCMRQPGRVLQGGDCDDADPSLHPGARDLCNGVDDDCDSETDEDSPREAFWPDLDGDGFGDAVASPTFACIPPSGMSRLPSDCDDLDATVRPGAVELCEGIDNDCDGAVDEMPVAVDWYPDADGDGHGETGATPLNTCVPQLDRVQTEDDCDDADASTYDGAPELCDTVDNDCDSAVDEDAADVSWYPDVDVDGFGDSSGAVVISCAAVAGHSTRGGDCDDDDGERNPGATEACDTIDNDCDGFVDEPPAGIVSCSVPNATPVCSTGTCLPGGCVTGFGDCDGVDFNGCETDVTSDPLHCGGCGTPCSAGNTCTAGVCDPVPIVAVAAGNGATCALRSSGVVACWGYGGSGQLGNDSAADRSTAVAVATIDDATAIAGGRGHFCARRAAGDVWCWGENGLNQLGDGTTVDRWTPVALSGGLTFDQLALGGVHSCARRAGDVWCWGGGGNGRLGDGSAVSRSAPVRAGTLDTVVDVDAGGFHSCAVTGDGRVWCWGDSISGQLGWGGGLPTHQRSPVVVKGPGSAPELLDAIAVATGERHTCVITDPVGAGTEVWCMGRGSEGQLGTGDTAVAHRPRQVLGLTDAASIEAVNNTTCATRSGGSVVCWGQGDRGQLGNDDTMNSLVATTARGITDVAQLTMGFRINVITRLPHACVLRDSGSVYCWGDNGTYQLGDGTLTQRNVPTLNTLVP